MPPLRWKIPVDLVFEVPSKGDDSEALAERGVFWGCSFSFVATSGAARVLAEGGASCGFRCPIAAVEEASLAEGVVAVGSVPPSPGRSNEAAEGVEGAGCTEDDRMEVSGSGGWKVSVVAD